MHLREQDSILEQLDWIRQAEHAQYMYPFRISYKENRPPSMEWGDEWKRWNSLSLID